MSKPSNKGFHSLFEAFKDYDPRSQLNEIKDLLELLKPWEEELYDEIEKTKSDDTDEFGDHYVNLCHQSVYRDAAISMAAVGALAPFIEGLLVHMFRFLRDRQAEQTVPGNHDRWKSASKIAWDPHLWLNPKNTRTQTGIATGTIQLMEALQIRDRFPDNLDRVLEALFQFRNKMLHNGTEWPVEEREKFEKTINDNKWSDWFSAAKKGEDPWCFYMTHNLIENCLETGESLLKGFSKILDEGTNSH